MRIDHDLDVSYDYLRLAGEAQRVLRGVPLAEQELPFALPPPRRTP